MGSIHIIIMMTLSLIGNKLVLLKNTISWKTSHDLMKPCMKVVRQLNLKKKEKIGDRGVITANL